MKSKEFIRESEDQIDADAAHALPATFVLPELQNQDAYLQYRFGVTLAAARAHSEGLVDSESVSEFGENMAIIARSKEEEETLRLALKLFGRNNASRLITTATSDEPKDTSTKSPCAPQYSRKLRKE